MCFFVSAVPEDTLAVRSIKRGAVSPRMLTAAKAKVNAEVRGAGVRVGFLFQFHFRHLLPPADALKWDFEPAHKAANDSAGRHWRQTHNTLTRCNVLAHAANMVGVRACARCRFLLMHTQRSVCDSQTRDGCDCEESFASLLL